MEEMYRIVKFKFCCNKIRVNPLHELSEMRKEQVMNEWLIELATYKYSPLLSLTTVR